MVSFSCNRCNDVVTKGKVANHGNSCGSNSFSCVDCMQDFDLVTIKPHTSCISEVAKYQGKYQSKPNGNPVKRSRAADSSDDDEKVAARAAPKPKRVVPTFSDSSDDDDSWVKAPAKKAAVRKAAVRAASASPAMKPKASPKTTPKASPALKPKTSPVLKAKAALSPKHVGVSASCTEQLSVPSFSLGSADQIAEVSRNVLDEAGATSLDVKSLCKKVVERFNARLAKQIKAAVEQAVAAAGAAHGIQLNDHTVVLRT